MLSFITICFHCRPKVITYIVNSALMIPVMTHYPSYYSHEGT